MTVAGACCCLGRSTSGKPGGEPANRLLIVQPSAAAQQAEGDGGAYSMVPWPDADQRPSPIKLLRFARTPAAIRAGACCPGRRTPDQQHLVFHGDIERPARPVPSVSPRSSRAPPAGRSVVLGGPVPALASTAARVCQAGPRRGGRLSTRKPSSFALSISPDSTRPCASRAKHLFERHNRARRPSRPGARGEGFSSIAALVPARRPPSTSKPRSARRAAARSPT